MKNNSSKKFKIIAEGKNSKPYYYNVYLRPRIKKTSSVQKNMRSRNATILNYESLNVKNANAPFYMEKNNYRQNPYISFKYNQKLFLDKKLNENSNYPENNRSGNRINNSYYNNNHLNKSFNNANNIKFNKENLIKMPVVSITKDPQIIKYNTYFKNNKYNNLDCNKSDRLAVINKNLEEDKDKSYSFYDDSEKINASENLKEININKSQNLNSNQLISLLVGIKKLPLKINFNLNLNNNKKEDRNQRLDNLSDNKQKNVINKENSKKNYNDNNINKSKNENKDSILINKKLIEKNINKSIFCKILKNINNYKEFGNNFKKNRKNQTIENYERNENRNNTNGSIRKRYKVKLTKK